MGDKFSKVKRFGVIVWREFFGILDGAAAARRWLMGHSIQHTGRGAKWVWARVTAAFLYQAVGGLPSRWRKRDCGRRWGAGELGGLIGKAGGYGW